jgi:RimJ/RimL family protein N-acetyltransferase
MFARTKRLTLRPAWPEDARALAAAIGHSSVARMLARVPDTFTAADAETFVARPRAADEPRFLILAHDAPAPTLVGGIAIQAEEDGAHLAYWLAPHAWGRGYATEAARAVIDMARHALPLTCLKAWHFADNPASARVLAKPGFSPTGEIVVRSSRARDRDSASIAYALDLGAHRAASAAVAIAA